MRKIRKSKVNEAIEVLWLNKRNGMKKKMKEEEVEKSQDAQCKIIYHYKQNERSYPISFSKYKILSQIKSHMNKKHWNKAKKLLLLLLYSSTDIEPLIWRYCFILTLYSNIDNLSNIFQFFKMCIGSSDSDRNLILKNILLLE
ncbi:PREDICTED: uncharacterized protein LOC108545576, partial [Eufriesea mexicana]|uniref:uncharacterized protein LOC108545576 n=1 Tax=Eufriesea mexicana TaxID=516756 RepID=UPI00083C8BC2